MVVLTPQEEARLLSDYSKIAWKLVHRYSDGRSSSLFSQEDLYQECMLVFVKHMQKCEDKSQLRRIQTMDLINAMTRFLLKNQALKLDANRTDQTRRILDTCAKKACLDELTGMYDFAADSIDEVIEDATFEQFLKRTKTRPLERTVMQKRKEGYKVSEIAQMTGRSHQVISYILKSTKKKYDNFVA